MTSGEQGEGAVTTSHTSLLDVFMDPMPGAPRVVFTQTYEGELHVPPRLHVARGLWEDMGCPESVTITITPGDTLNDDANSLDPAA